LLVRDAGHLLLVLAGAPASEREVGVAVDQAREERAAARVDADVRVGGGFDRRDPAVLDGDPARLEVHLGGAMAAEVRQSRLRGSTWSALSNEVVMGAGRPHPAQGPKPVFPSRGLGT